MRSRMLLPILFSAVFVGAVFIFDVPAAEATSNPLIRNCTINGGTFETHPLGTDDMALCRWNAVMIDSQSLLSSLNGVTSDAASIIVRGWAADYCIAASVPETMLSTGETICLFEDGSKLSLGALKAGLSDADRLHLKEVLLAR